MKDSEAARKVLQLRQNAVLGTGNRARPVTVTLSTEEALVLEVCGGAYKVHDHEADTFAT